MKSAFATLVLMGAVFLSPAAAHAVPLNFDFSVTSCFCTHTLSETPVPGTFTGEIFGLQPCATSSATSVIIQSIPAGMNQLVCPPINAMLWNQQFQNSFTVVNCQITAGGFWAEQCGSDFQLYLDGDGGPYNFLNLDGDDQHFVWGANGLAAANFTLVAAAAPEVDGDGTIPGLASLAVMMALVSDWRRRA